MLRILIHLVRVDYRAAELWKVLTEHLARYCGDWRGLLTKTVCWQAARISVVGRHACCVALRNATGLSGKDGLVLQLVHGLLAKCRSAVHVVAEAVGVGIKGQVGLVRGDRAGVGEVRGELPVILSINR